MTDPITPGMPLDSTGGAGAPRPSTATAYAPAGIGNVAVGFDVLGHAVEAVGDRVTVRRLGSPRVEITGITGCEEVLPLEAERNTATAGLVQLVRERELDFGFSVSIEKGIPLGSGMGGSAASAVGAMVAANALLDEPLDLLELLRYALTGEKVASGSAHADNIAPGLYGGMTLVRAMDPPDVVRIPVPGEIRCVLVHPHLRLDTRISRGVLPNEIPVGLHVRQAGNLGGFLAGCFMGDLALIRRSFSDLIAEPRRAPLIPGFAAVKAAALAAGALGCSISGGGPSVFAWCVGDDTAAAAREAMVGAWAAGGTPSDAYVSPVNAPGARIVNTE